MTHPALSVVGIRVTTLPAVPPRANPHGHFRGPLSAPGVIVADLGGPGPTGVVLVRLDSGETVFRWLDAEVGLPLGAN